MSKFDDLFDKEKVVEEFDEETPFRRDSHVDSKDHRFNKQYKIKNYRNTENVGIWQETENYIARRKDLQLDVKSSCFRYKFKDLVEEPSFEALENTLPIGVFKMDTLEAARMLYQKKGEGEKVAFLNMASEFKAGGGVANGSLAQEESIARRSNLVQSLNKAFYPLASDELLFSPEVTVIRDEQLRFDPDHEFPCAAISCAAIRKPDLRADGHYRQKHATLMENKILAILKVAIMNDIDNLVLGAFGCGAFCNPVNDVAAIFKKILVMDGYARFFKRIVFAILTKSEKDWNNLKVFSTMFAGFVVPNNK